MPGSDFTMPPRSIVSIQPVPPEQGGGILIGCDCGTTTQLVVEGLEQVTEARELAFTCDGCQSSTWFTVGPLSDLPADGAAGGGTTILTCPACSAEFEASDVDPDATLGDLWDHLLGHPAMDAQFRERMFVLAQQNAREQP